MNDHCRSAARLLCGIALIGVTAFCVETEAATRVAIDTARSSITVRVGKSGIFRAFADDHEIRGVVKEGYVDEAEQSVAIVVDARALRVLDPKLSPNDRAEVQRRMLGADVLDASRFSEIRFVSKSIEATASGSIVHGTLTLHGETRPVTASVTKQQDHYTGTVRLKQTDFGITPITIAGGTVKVKDELTIAFDIVTQSGRAAGRQLR